jgi:hypothetical protein
MIIMDIRDQLMTNSIIILFGIMKTTLLAMEYKRRRTYSKWIELGTKYNYLIWSKRMSYTLKNMKVMITM